MVATSCDLNAPRCATTAQQVRLHGSRGGVFVDHRPPPGTPVIPCFKDIIWYNIMMSRPRYTHPAFGRVVSWQVGWKWGWKGGWGWDERENEMKDYLTRTRGRERKSRGKFGKSKHQHQHTWPGAGKPWKGKEKEKRRPTDTEQDQRRGERRKRLNQPNTAKPTPT